MKIKTIGVIIMLVLLSAACNQEPIFYIISTETAPLPPRIEGAPTNMVVFPREYPGIEEPVNIMYVASGRLHWYAKAPGDDHPGWDADAYPMPQPEGKIISLAVAGDRLYALCRDGRGVNAKLRYIESNWEEGEKWKTISSEASSYPVIQTIYTDPESTRLFAGVGRSSYDILYLDTAKNENKLKTLISDSTLLSGVVYREGTYYLSTRGKGIYQISETELAKDNITINQLKDNSAIDDKKNDRIFMSIIMLANSDIIAVEREGGFLYQVSDDGDFFERLKYTVNNNWIATGKYATEAITLWEDYLDPQTRLLVVGIQGGLYSTTAISYTYGYVEFVLNPDGSLNKAQIRHDPGNLRTVFDQDRYTTSLGKHPINSLFQTPQKIDDNMTFFASTQTAGLWSYRNIEKNGGLQWNAEN